MRETAPLLFRETEIVEISSITPAEIDSNEMDESMDENIKGFEDAGTLDEFDDDDDF